MNPLLFVILSYIDVRLLLYQDSLGNKKRPSQSPNSFPIPFRSAARHQHRACRGQEHREWHRGLQAHDQRRRRRLCLIWDLEGKDGFLESWRRASAIAKARWSSSWPRAQAGPHRKEHALCWHPSRKQRCSQRRALAILFWRTAPCTAPWLGTEVVFANCAIILAGSH